MTSVSSMPALLGQRRGVDEVDLLLGVAGEDPDQHRDPEQAGVVLGDPAAELGGDPVDRPVAEALGEAAELLAERHERRQRLHLLGPDGGDVDRVGDHPAGQRPADLIGGDRPGAVLGLGRRGAQVRSDDDVRRARTGRCSVNGSSGNTSSAAPPTFPDSRPSASASRSTSSPRAQLTIRTPSFILAIASASIQSIVSGVFGRWIVMMSARA